MRKLDYIISRFGDISVGRLPLKTVASSSAVRSNCTFHMTLMRLRSQCDAGVERRSAGRFKNKCKSPEDAHSSILLESNANLKADRKLIIEIASK